MNIVLSPIPPELPADGQTYQGIVVSLTSSGGSPVVTPFAVTVFLSSALPGVGNVVPSVTIAAGKSFALANVTTSGTPGTTRVTASATGLRTAAATIQTVVPSGFPDHLVLFAVPSVQLARTSSRGELVVQVQDDLGIPARTASDLIVSMASSDNRVVGVSSPSLVVPAQQSVAIENYAAGLVTGSASITASASGFASGSAIIRVVAAPPLVLKVTPEPSLISSNSKGRVVVTLRDGNGDPAEAPADIQVYITSSNVTALAISGASGSNPAVVTIPKNQVYTETTFQSLAPGRYPAFITASAHGLVAGFGNVTVATPTPPNRLLVFLAPNPFPASKARLPAIGIGLQYVNPTSMAIQPASASSTFPVVVTASDNATGKVIESVTVPFNAGASYAVAPFNSTLLPSTAIVTAAAQNLVSAQAAIKTLRPVLPIGPSPTRIVVTPVEPVLPADGNQYQGLLVSLRDSTGGPAVAPSDIPVRLSLNRQDVVQLAAANESVTVRANQTYAIALVRTTSIEETVNVTAQSPGYAPSWTIMSTKALSPAKIALYVSPFPSMVSSDGTSAILAVQLQDLHGNPASARAQTQITITSSNSSLIPKPLTVTIQSHVDYQLTHLSSTGSSQAVLTAISPGLVSTNTTIRSVGFPLGVQLYSASPVIFLNGTETLSVTAELLGAPLQNVSVTWSASGGTLSSQQTKTTASGTSSVTWRPNIPGPVTYYATISSPAFGNRNLTGSFLVLQVPPKPSTSLLSTIIGYLWYIVAGAAVAVIVVVFVWRRRRGVVKEEEGEFDIGGPGSSAVGLAPSTYRS